MEGNIVTFILILKLVYHISMILFILWQYFGL